MGTAFKVFYRLIESNSLFDLNKRIDIYICCIFSISHRHTNAAAAFDNEIDAAAMEFERRFHISVDASEDRDQQVYNRFITSIYFSILSGYFYVT